MTRGQEGYVYGWQCKLGTKKQLVLDTLFVELIKPPTEVQFDGLPKNVVPIYPTANTIQASLPNDDKVFISRTQIEVLINFAMTDFGEVLSVPHRFLPDSGDSGGIRCIPEEWKLAGGSANIAIPVVTRSGGIQAFRN